ncbi:hypothetical protein AXF42_Ash008642 [Apostasia shenzhenica]|uniref:Uncharacterized protein n=1 Tax=Apostasia shenzhenica TaxID=1088818 RepID=A0A2I0B1Y0_9ASPA|nr:hypothetical protein AXF42_Ash008642 [Apostasia shenzhenica]
MINTHFVRDSDFLNQLITTALEFNVLVNNGKSAVIAIGRLKNNRKESTNSVIEECRLRVELQKVGLESRS